MSPSGRHQGPGGRAGPASGPGPGSVDDLFHTRTVPFAFHGVRLELDLARTVFASAGVDPGTALLLRHLQAFGLDDVERVLDVGCGQGTLGVVLQALDPARQVCFVDRDALACRFAVRNLVRNGLQSFEGQVGGSLGYDDVDRGVPYDLVVSNIPGKVGPAVITHLVEDAPEVCGGRALVGFVVVRPLADRVRRLLVAPRFDLQVDTGSKRHQVFIARVAGRSPAVGQGARPARSGFERGIYDRGVHDFRSGRLTWRATTVAGIDEFDELTPSTRLLRRALHGVRATPSLIVNPGQGHRAVIAAEAGYRPRLLVDRDLLSLRASQRCLTGAGHEGARLLHAIEIPTDDIDASTLTIVHAGPKVHAPWLSHQVTAYLDRVEALPGGGDAIGPRRDLVLSGRSGVLGRLESDVLRRRGGRIAFKATERGHRVVRYVPRGARRGPPALP